MPMRRGYSQSSSSYSSLGIPPTDIQASRSYLFIFVVLWFSALQICLFTWTQIPPGFTPGRALPLGGLVERSSSFSSQPRECQQLGTNNQQLCILLHQIWETVPEPADLATESERRVFPNAVVRPKHSPDTVVLATHLGANKLDVLLIQSKWWGGPISVSMYLRNREEILSLAKFLDAHPVELQNVSFHVVLEKTNLPYPHNVLRNLAIEYLDADFFVALDVDFIPSFGAHEGLHKLLQNPRSRIRQQLMDHHVLVLPAFERVQNSEDESVTENMLPRTKEDLKGLFQERKVIGFHMAGSPVGHGPTNFPKWLKHETGTTYEIEYKNVYEPYVMGYRPGIPRYWENFRGYGYNKFSWFFELNHACYHFGVLRDFFVVHMNHPIVSRELKRDQTEANRDEWKKFKTYLGAQYKQTCDVLPPLGGTSHTKR